jgi:hypothetical protein
MGKGRIHGIEIGRNLAVVARHNVRVGAIAQRIHFTSNRRWKSSSSAPAEKICAGNDPRL